jgi:hypothetical protein
MSSCPFLRRITLRVGQALDASFIKNQDKDMRVEVFPAMMNPGSGILEGGLSHLFLISFRSKILHLMDTRRS